MLPKQVAASFSVNILAKFVSHVNVQRRNRLGQQYNPAAGVVLRSKTPCLRRAMVLLMDLSSPHPSYLDVTFVRKQSDHRKVL